MKTFECNDIYKGCDYKVQGKDEQEILDRASEHGREKHGLKEINEDMKDKVRSKIRDAKAA